jgi:hypothetical protein
VDMFVDLGHKLAPFSGPLTEAEIKAEQRSLMGDVREANTLGPDLARLMDAQSRASDELRQLLLPIKQALAEKIADIMEGIADWMQENRGMLAGILEAVKELIKASVEIGTLHWGDAQDTLTGMPDKIADAIDKANRRKSAEEEDGLAIQQLWGLWNQIPGAGRPANAKVLDILGGMAGTNPNLSMPGDGGVMGGGVGGEF